MALDIAGFEDLVEIGRGGFGVVYRARQTALDRTVAIKVMAAEASDPDTLRRFERETRILGKLSEHPNIVTVHDSGTTPDGRPWVAMAYLPTGSLGDRLRSKGPMSPQAAASVAVRVAGALETAHRAGIFHRDVKPENILVTSYDEPALADFGIARMVGGTQTVAGVVTASLTHAVPEVLDGAPAAASGDVYALGSTIFTLLNGRPAFDSGPDGTVPQMITSIVSKPVPDLEPIGVPKALADAIRAAMAKDPAQRPASAEEFATLVRDAEAASGWGASRFVVMDATGVVHEPAGAADAAAPPTDPRATTDDAEAAPGPTPADDDRTRQHAVSGPRGRVDVPAAASTDADVVDAPPTIEDAPSPDAPKSAGASAARPGRWLKLGLVGLGIVAVVSIAATVLTRSAGPDAIEVAFQDGPNSGAGRVLFTRQLDEPAVAMTTDGLNLYLATPTQVEARTLEDGIVRWAFPRATPTPATLEMFTTDGAVVFGDGDAVVVLDGTSGTEVSRASVDGQPTTAHVTRQGVVLAIAGPSIQRVDLDGAPRWRVEKPLAPGERYVVHDHLEGLPIIATTDFEMLAIEPGSGEVLWSIGLPGNGPKDVLLVTQGNELVFTAAAVGGQLLVRAQTAVGGEVLWEVNRGAVDPDAVVIEVHDGMLVVADGETVAGLDGNSGQPGWEVDLQTGSDLWLTTDTGRVWTVGLVDFEQVTVYSVYSGEVACGPTDLTSYPEWPTLTGGRWHWADTEGRIVAVDVPDGGEGSPVGGDCTAAWVYDLPDDANAAVPLVPASDLGYLYVADDWQRLTGVRLWDE